jgi:hypothetical protein
MAKKINISGSSIKNIYDDGFGGFKVSVKGSKKEFKISRDELCIALNGCQLEGELAKKYYHLYVKEE